MECFSLIQTPVGLQELIVRPQVRDIFINGPQKIFYQEKGVLEKALVSCYFDSTEHLLRWSLDLLGMLGRSWDVTQPFIDAKLGLTHRLHMVFPPVSDGPIISIRSHQKQNQNYYFYPENIFFELKKVFLNKSSLVICGASGSGKTTLASLLIDSLSQEERILAIEDTPELMTTHPHFMSLKSQSANTDGFGMITATQIIRQTLRMKPDRILLGECRGKEVLDFLQLLNTGHLGSLCTLHANSAQDAVRRLELLALLSGERLTGQLVRSLIAFGIGHIVYLEKTSLGSKIVDFYHLQGMEGDVLLLRPVIVSPGYAN